MFSQYLGTISCFDNEYGGTPFIIVNNASYILPDSESTYNKN